MGFLQKIIRNNAMKTDPHEIYNWRVFALACAVSALTRLSWHSLILSRRHALVELCSGWI